MLFQPDKLDSILAIIKEVESHESRIHWTLIKNIPRFSYGEILAYQEIDVEGKIDGQLHHMYGHGRIYAY